MPLRFLDVLVALSTLGYRIVIRRSSHYVYIPKHSDVKLKMTGRGVKLSKQSLYEF